jgi:hypothetical protein
MSDGWDYRDRHGERGALAFGLILIVLGAIFLASETFNLDLSRYGWPMFVIVPGLVLLALGLVIPNEAGLGLAIPGSIVTATGLVLLFQDTTGAYASWAYAWALVAPGSVGVALFLYGLLHRKIDMIDAGLRTVGVGIGLFIGFGLFFENVINLDPSGDTAGLRNAFPFLAVALGVVIVLSSLLPRSGSRVRGRFGPSDWRGDEPPATAPVAPAPTAPVGSAGAEAPIPPSGSNGPNSQPS